MLMCRWTVAAGWEAPRIEPFGNLSISPAASCLNYATQCFEGMKVYRGFDGKLRLFRPDHNAKRLISSAERVALPAFDDKELVKLIKALIRVDAPRWLPKEAAGRFLYIRPALVGTGEQTGVQLPEEAMLYVIMIPWPDFSTETSPRKTPRTPGLRLCASQGDTIRAWPGGFGYAKVGANYGTTFKAHGVAHSKGFDQILWLFGPDCQVTEAGASNFFAVVRDATTSKIELLTAPLTENLILDGVTRRSVLELVRSRLSEQLSIAERNFTMQELVQAWNEGRVLEAFVSGTAFFIMPVSLIHFRGLDLAMPDIHETEGKRYASIIKGWLRIFSILRLQASFEGPNNRKYTRTGTAFAFNEYYALTALHNTWDMKLGPAKTIVLIPDQRLDVELRPTMNCVAAAGRVEWIRSQKSEHDFCMVAVAKPFDLGVRLFPIGDVPLSRHTGEVIGYAYDLPSDFEGQRLIRCKGKVWSRRTAAGVLVEHKVNTVKVNSGSLVLINKKFVGVYVLFVRVLRFTRDPDSGLADGITRFESATRIMGSNDGLRRVNCPRVFVYGCNKG
ncbi:hypothetical protein NUW58_g6774 [Xylaria curta]|uniref:Uncharacterized protein n=1 Tax=Xylaria curta TaxID=42375 RepID=A0ACC1NR79_9PEZI|nr:hypothetical protein NUW58_g6774 [Xylaria curta]